MTIEVGEPGPTRQLAERITGITYDDLDQNTLDYAKLLLLDQLGCELIGSTLPWTEPVFRYVARFDGQPEARVVNHGTRLAVHDAALVNAVFGQNCEWDDFTTRGMGAGHGGAGTWPVALAMGEFLGATGKDVLVAGVAGYECMARVGKAVRPFSGPGGYPVHGILSPLGAAAVSGSLLRLSAQQMTMALSIAASQSGGLNEYGHTGGEVKRLHAGIGARAGVQSAFLSQLGFTGPPTALEGNAGLVRSFGAHPKIDELTKPADHFAILESGPKVFPTVADAASSIEAMGMLVESHDFSHDDIGQVEIAISDWAKQHSGRTYQPADVISAQYSIPYSVALRAVIGSNDLTHYMDRTLWSDARILNVANRVVFSHAPEAVGDARHFCRMIVTLKDGSTRIATITYPRGSFLNPVSPEEIKAKFTSLSGRVLGASRTSDLIEIVLKLDVLQNVGELTDLLCP